MKRPIAILFLMLLLIQAIPVLHFFSPETNFYAYVDEDKPGETKPKAKQDAKEFISYLQVYEVVSSSLQTFESLSIYLPASPFLESFTPPPNTTC